MAEDIRNALKHAAVARWGEDNADIALFRSTPLIVEVSHNPEDPGTERVKVSIDDPGPFTYSILIMLESMAASYMVMGQALMDRLQIRCWRDGRPVEGATLTAQLLANGPVTEATFEVLLFAPPEEGSQLLRSKPIPVRELAAHDPDLRGQR